MALLSLALFCAIPDARRAHHGTQAARGEALDGAAELGEGMGLELGKSGPFAQEARVGVAELDAEWIALKNRTVWTKAGPSITGKVFKSFFLAKV
jgi:hypothetical protein